MDHSPIIETESMEKSRPNVFWLKGTETPSSASNKPEKLN
jgi:hypothetical protein